MISCDQNKDISKGLCGRCAPEGKGSSDSHKTVLRTTGGGREVMSGGSS